MTRSSALGRSARHAQQECRMPGLIQPPLGCRCGHVGIDRWPLRVRALGGGVVTE